LKYFYVAIEKSIETFETYKSLWNAHGIDGIKADTMSDGIKRAIETERSSDRLLFVSIVADEVKFMPQLKVLSGAIIAPILIAVSKENYCEIEHHKALRNGADFYAPFCEKTSRNVHAVLAAIESIHMRSQKQNSPNKVIAHSDILIDVGLHKAFFKDKEVSLTGTEMRILYYMMLNRGIILGHENFFLNAYEDYEEATPDSLYSAIKRLRKKIKDATQTDYIETVKAIGYRLRKESRSE
jgi:DNA-binding response OmpR family regulator